MTVDTLVLTPALAAQAQHTPPRGAATVTGTQRGGTIRGRVIAAATRQPLHRVRITLRTPDPASPSPVPATPGPFELTNIPPGAYTLSASRGGYLPIQYGQRRPRESGRTFD